MNLRKLFELIKLYSCIQNHSCLILDKTLLRSMVAFVKFVMVRTNVLEFSWLYSVPKHQAL